jgi:hypothetical protein
MPVGCLLFLCCCLRQEVVADVSQSPDYSILIDSLCGGALVRSADYSVNSVVAPVAAGTSGNNRIVAKQGFAGQVYDISALKLSAVPPEVNENSTRRVLAAAVLDDETKLVFSGNDCVWNVNGWPLAAVSPDGLVSADSVWRTETGGVSAVCGSCTGVLSLVVYDVDSDNYSSYANDGLNDSWQVSFFGLNNSNAAPEADPDSDGGDNHYEWTVGTIPTDSTSRLLIKVRKIAGTPANADIVIDPAYSNRTYTIQKRAVLCGGNWGNVQSVAKFTNGTEQTIRDLSVTNNPVFYRVQVDFTP